MSDIFQIGTSGLRAAQSGLSTTGNNITNVNTPGYTRQRVDQSTQPDQVLGGVSFGRGAKIDGISRIVDEFLNVNVRTSATNVGSAASYETFARQVDSLLANTDSGVSAGMQQFFDAVQGVSDNPTSIAARQNMLGQAETLTARFNTLHSSLDNLNSGVNTQIRSKVSEVNSLTSSIAEINLAVLNGSSANSLEDNRDQYLNQLAELVGLSVVKNSNGTVNVSTGSGQVLVSAGTSSQLNVAANALDPSQLEVTYNVAGTAVVVSNAISGGELGGLIEVRDDVISEAKNALGRVAAGLAQSFNTQHTSGQDLDGNRGANFFSSLTPTVTGAAGNTGSMAASFNPNDIAGLTTSDYQVDYDGTNFTLTRLSDSTTQTFTGPAFNADGLSFNGASAVAGDRYLIQPMDQAARDLSVLISQPREIAAASRIRSSVSSANVSDATVSAPQILNANHASLTSTVTITFNSPASTYEVNGDGATNAYTSGGNIDINGWRIQISGTPVAGDEYVVQLNSGGVGDNSNALALSDLQFGLTLENGSATLSDVYSQLIGDIGTKTNRAKASLTAMEATQESAQAARDSVSGVNLDEEAANLLKYQQAYQASARVIAIGNELFGTLLSAIN